MGKLYAPKLNIIALEDQVDTLARTKHAGPAFTQVNPLQLNGSTKPEKASRKNPWITFTDHENVFLYEVGQHDYSMKQAYEFEIDVRHVDPLKGAWGVTRSIAYIKYALLEDSGTYEIFTRGVLFAADIKMKLMTEFHQVKDFKPHYELLQSQFGGNITLFSRTHAITKMDDGSSFATFKGVLFHELLHFKFAQLDGALRYKDFRKAVGKDRTKYATRKDAVEALKKQVKPIWIDAREKWSGYVNYVPSLYDHLHIHELQSRYYLREYEAEPAH